MKRCIAIAIMLALLCSCACAQQAGDASRVRAKELVAKMSLWEKFGQVTMFDFRKWQTAEELEARRAAQGMEESRDNRDEKAQLDPPNLRVMNDEIRSIIASYRLDNVILYAENCQDTAELARLVYDFKLTASDAGLLPMLLCVDQEGGNVARLASGCCMSGNMALGATGDASNVRLSTQVIARELRALGINCNFAPVADVNANPLNPVIGLRSFSADPKTVSIMAQTAAETQREEKILSCAKHFPGHGDTDTDSHTGLPLVEKDYESWLNSDAVPFYDLVQSNAVDMIMSAHIQYPGLDDTRVQSAKDGQDIYLPATLSKRILTGILREEWGFEGVIVTDAMNMDAIAEHFGAYDAVVYALAAGADLICMPLILRSAEDSVLLDALYKRLEDALESGELSMERLDAAAERVVAMKLRGGLFEATSYASADEAAQTALAVVGCKEHRAIERQLAARCVKLVGGEDFVPFAPKSGENIVVLMPGSSGLLSARHAFMRMEKEGVLENANVQFFCYADMNALDRDMRMAVANADYLILGSRQTTASMRDPQHWYNTTVQDALAHVGDAQVAILCLGLPYQQEMYAKDYPCVMLYNFSGMDEADLGQELFSGKYGPMIPAGIELIFGSVEQ